MLLKNMPESIRQLALLRTKQDKTSYRDRTKNKTDEELLNMDVINLFSWVDTFDVINNGNDTFWDNVYHDRITNAMIEYAASQLQKEMENSLDKNINLPAINLETQIYF